MVNTWVLTDLLRLLGCGATDEADATPSLLLLGPPGVGKTTLLRDITATLADQMGRQVVVVDTSNEIAGDGDVPHPCIGRARRIPVPRREKQHEKLLEAVCNANPDVVVVDELSTEEEVRSTRTISQRGVSLVATAHGFGIHQLLANPALRSLVGGLNTVTLGDAAAMRLAKGNHTAPSAPQKTRTERAGLPVFNILVEVHSHSELWVWTNVAHAVDTVLEHREAPIVQRRFFANPRDKDGAMCVEFKADQRRATHPAPKTVSFP